MTLAELEGPFKKTLEGKLLVGEIELLCLLAKHERIKEREDSRKPEPGSGGLPHDLSI